MVIASSALPLDDAAESPVTPIQHIANPLPETLPPVRASVCCTEQATKISLYVNSFTPSFFNPPTPSPPSPRRPLPRPPGLRDEKVRIGWI